MINIITDKDAIWVTDNYDVVLLGTTIYCMLTNGFQSKMRVKYPYIDEINDSTNYGDLRKLGKRVTIQGNPVISLLYIAKYPHSKREYIDYEALEHALETANAEFKGKKVMTTLLGCTPFDGNGDREKVLEIMERALKDVDVDVYDYPQLDKNREKRLFLSKMRKQYKKTDPEKFQQMWDNQKEILKGIYLE